MPHSRPEFLSMQSCRNRATHNLHFKSTHDDKEKAQANEESTKSKIITNMINNAKVASLHAPPAQCRYVYQ
ncbi:hypothetical protein AGABI1DRAFT_110265 [Agaricus bisporus var. burnettii JB137-S8]|uniref:Uncharacterized protein n=1 Tax=Agaricus bisporus var. burnettii (strain JB137-S8 / ATCC MYA-4627 / FGSC 10392) TaxID=597362 RepID=K5XJV4_AGABU|nr:uncharacterized protein AGABI1DRAFT_110265 [Agaricus bisporus var. burnettii JB137-S8]EKM83622.1 hypothetical protein AGABI1DRAFT_110265 [Agaricus bisporus var. burnettii JB137-S8]